LFSGYDVEDSDPLPVDPRNVAAPPRIPVDPRNVAAPPSIAFGPKSYTPEATKENGNNGTEVTVLTPGAAAGSRTSLMNSLASTVLVFILLPLLII